MTVAIEVRCPQEGIAIGTAVVERGKPLTADPLARAFKPVRPEYSLKDEAGHATIKDGEQAICPRCKGPLTVVEQGAEPGIDPVYLMPGHVKIAAA